MSGDWRAVAFNKFYLKDELGVVVTTAVFVAEVVLLTDGHLAAFPKSRRRSTEGAS